MARRIRNAALDSRAARSKLKRRSDHHPYYTQIEKALHLGYWPPLNGGRSGSWQLRLYKRSEKKYEQKIIGTADDINDANGHDILDYWQAVEKARETLKQNPALASTALTVDTVMEDYLGFIQAERKDKLNAQNRTDVFILPAFRGRDAATINRKEIEAWFRKLASTPARKRTAAKAKKIQYKPLNDPEAIRKRKSTANRVLGTFKAALNRAYENGDLKCDPVWRLVKPFRGVNAARARFLTLTECQRLINGAEPGFRELLRAALATGSRYQELARLTVADFNPGSRSKTGKLIVPATIAINESKSGKSRYVYLNDEAVAFFSGLCAGRSGSEPMLKRGDRMWQPSEQARPMFEACERAKIAPINFHATRHTYASLAIMNGMPMFVLARNLGHSDTRMIERHYGHLAKDYEAEMIRKGAPSFGIEQDSKVVNLHG